MEHLLRQCLVRAAARVSPRSPAGLCQGLTLRERGHASLSMQPSLPIIDIAPFIDTSSSDEGARIRVAKELDRACRDVGFFYLVGHGVPQADIQHLHALAKQFFQSPSEKKDAISISQFPESGRGYQRLGENVTYGRRDWHEAIDFYAEPSEGAVDLETLIQAPGATDRSVLKKMQPFVFGSNQWPLEPQGFRSAAERHFERAALAGQALMEAMALAFGLPPQHFKSLTDRSFWCARVIGYPPLGEAAAAGSEGEIGDSVGEHTDYGCWTILSPDDTPGALQVRGLDGSWMTAEPMDNAFVVNLGDMLSVWTQGRFTATPHRVRHTQPGRYRTSIAFFYEPNYDAVINPLFPADLNGASMSSGAGNSSEPLQRALQGHGLVYGEHLFAKVSGNFNFLSN